MGETLKYLDFITDNKDRFFIIYPFFLIALKKQRRLDLRGDAEMIVF